VEPARLGTCARRPRASPRRSARQARAARALPGARSHWRTPAHGRPGPVPDAWPASGLRPSARVTPGCRPQRRGMRTLADQASSPAHGRGAAPWGWFCRRSAAPSSAQSLRARCRSSPRPAPCPAYTCRRMQARLGSKRWTHPFAQHIARPGPEDGAGPPQRPAQATAEYAPLPNATVAGVASPDVLLLTMPDHMGAAHRSRRLRGWSNTLVISRGRSSSRSGRCSTRESLAVAV